MILYAVSLNILLNLNIVTGTFKSSCGIDKSPVDMVYAGLATIETYPWLGILYYPYQNKRYTTTVVLVSRQIVLGTAAEIDEMPKIDFRRRAKVVIGQNCSGTHINLRDYSYHPDYFKNIFSALAIIQLEVDSVKIELRPICPPPAHFMDSKFYAMTLSDDCRKSTINIYKMQYVPKDECHEFYRRSGLDVDSIWPSHVACARSLVNGHCVWRSGAVLMVKQGWRWRLLGFGVYGPGCEAPARFLDYGMYHRWVRSSVDRIGKPAISRIAPNHIILRRTLSNVQRFGLCDPEESLKEIYNDQIRISRENPFITTARYNISLYTDIEYSCILFKADYDKQNAFDKPKITLRRWCAGPVQMCHGFQFLEIHFYVEIVFYYDLTLSIIAYGRMARIIDPKRALQYINKYEEDLNIYSYNTTKRILADSNYKADRTSFWFYKEDG